MLRLDPFPLENQLMREAKESLDYTQSLKI
jgi:hypothetical protein